MSVGHTVLHKGRYLNIVKVVYWRNFFGKIEIVVIIVYYVMRSKNGVLCAVAGSLAAEPSDTLALSIQQYNVIIYVRLKKK
jgi:uncharacterized membrane protein